MNKPSVYASLKYSEGLFFSLLCGLWLNPEYAIFCDDTQANLSIIGLSVNIFENDVKIISVDDATRGSYEEWWWKLKSVYFTFPGKLVEADNTMAFAT